MTPFRRSPSTTVVRTSSKERAISDRSQADVLLYSLMALALDDKGFKNRIDKKKNKEYRASR